MLVKLLSLTTGCHSPLINAFVLANLCKHHKSHVAKKQIHGQQTVRDQVSQLAHENDLQRVFTDREKERDRLRDRQTDTQRNRLRDRQTDSCNANLLECELEQDSKKLNNRKLWIVFKPRQMNTHSNTQKLCQLINVATHRHTQT